YLLQWAAAWLLLPPVWAALYTVALPYAGYYALLYSERAGGAFRRTRTFLRFLWDRALQQRLASQGLVIIARIRELGEMLPPVAALTNGSIAASALPRHQLPPEST